MISAMTFARAVEVYTEFLKRNKSTDDACTSILEFLEWDEPDEDQFAQEVRIVLVSAEFSKELTTSVIWLNERGLDIECVRIKPYSDNGRILADIQQIIPLPEADTNQWGHGTLKAMDELIEAFPDEPISYRVSE